MPLYDYKCVCGQTVEVLQNTSDWKRVTCLCGQTMTRSIPLFATPKENVSATDLSKFGTQAWVDARRKQCGVEV